MMYRKAAKILLTQTPMTVSEWADKYRYLSPEASAEPGKWHTSRAEFQRGMMDAVLEPGAEEVILMCSSQVGKTEILLNVCGYYISQDPCPILNIQPTEAMGETWSKDRFTTMVRDTSVLKGKIKAAKSRDSGNTILHKIFPGGHITVAGANSPASLASRPIRLVKCDEIDRFPPSAGSEGDPVSLAKKRATTFWNRKILLVSTPTVKGLSRIETAFDETDKRKFFVPCYGCGEMQYLKWSNVQWNKDKADVSLPETAVYVCEKCGITWTDAQRWAAVRKGKWRPTAKATNKKKIGFHIWEAYSSWVTLSEMVTDFLSKKNNPETLKTFVNTSLGESWEDAGLKVGHINLYARRTKYKAEVPAGGLVLVCGVDVQDDRLEGEVIAFGQGSESWSIEYFIIYGDMAGRRVWQELDHKLLSTYKHESKIKMRISCTAIDSGGHFTDQVYQFCQGKENRRIFAVKGASTIGKPLVSRPTTSNKFEVKLFSIGTDTAKETIYARLQMNDPGPGYMHFPVKDRYDEEYFQQLTAEKATTKYIKGFPYRVWVKTRARNEALDIRVYANAACAILNPNYEKIAESYTKGKTKKKKKIKKSSWMNRR